MSQCRKVEHACKYTAVLVYFCGETEYNSCPLECGLALVTAQSADSGETLHTISKVWSEETMQRTAADAGTTTTAWGETQAENRGSLVSLLT